MTTDTKRKSQIKPDIKTAATAFLSALENSTPAEAQAINARFNITHGYTVKDMADLMDAFCRVLK